MVAELLERWLAHLQGLGRSPSTLYGYRNTVNRDVIPAIGTVRLSKLNAGHLDALYSSLRERGLAPATVRQIHAIMRAGLHQAVRWGLVPRNVASLASAPSQPQREQHPPTIEVVIALIQAAESLDPMFGLYVRVVAATGMRRGEACGLRWSDIDLDVGKLVVQRSHIAIRGSVGDQPTKTRSVRTVTVEAGTVAALTTAWRAARQLARFAGVDDDTRRAGYVFSFDADGAQAWRGDMVSARWDRARRTAGAEGVRLHDLRHWQATQLLDAGVPVPTVAARLGHADGTTTMKIALVGDPLQSLPSAEEACSDSSSTPTPPSSWIGSTRYVAEHVELAYASTAAAAQGRTVDHALVVIDRATDVRNLYVAMSRGTQSNHAYLATPGEHTAHDVFVHCLVSDWIDQPAHTRRAELRGEEPHRAGLLDGTMLRDLLERRHLLASELDLAEARQQRLPTEIRSAQAAKAAAERTIADLQQQQHAAEATLADYDRPLRRRHHQNEIISARRHLVDLPHRLVNAQRDLAVADDTLSDLDRAASDTRTVLTRRADIEADIDDLDHEIAQDLHIRTRVTRREQPEAVVTVLGQRPGPGHDARQWGHAAGRLAQHQAAFTIHNGLGPRPDYNRSAYRHSHETMTDVLQPLTGPVMHRSIDLSDLGLSL